MLDITEIRIKKINKGNLLAAASICINDCFIVNEIKLLNGKNGRYINMPKIRMKNKDYVRDFSYPLNNETREQLLDKISEAYDDIVVEE